jgi:hypothetical protein
LIADTHTGKFTPGQIISHPVYRVGVICETDSRVTTVAFCAEEDRVFLTQKLRSIVHLLENPPQPATRSFTRWPKDVVRELPQESFGGKWLRKISGGFYDSYCDHALTEETCSHCKAKRRAGKSKSKPNDPPRMSRMIQSGGEPSPVDQGLAINILEYPSPKHRKPWELLQGEKLKKKIEPLIDAAKVGEVKVRDVIEQSATNPAHELTCPIPRVKGNPTLQRHTRQLFIDWNRILNAVGKVLDSWDSSRHPQAVFGQRVFRKSGGVDGSCSRCGSELFVEKKRQLICRDCGKYSVAPKKGKLPFHKEREQLNDIRNADDDLENMKDKEEQFLNQSVVEDQEQCGGEHNYSVPSYGSGVSMGDILLAQGFTDFSVTKARARKITRKNTWLYNPSKLFTVLCRKFPLIRDIDGGLRTRIHGMTAVGKLDYERQFREAAVTMAAVYWWGLASPFQTDEQIAEMLNKGRDPVKNVPILADRLKQLRELFIDTGSTMFEQESGRHRQARREDRTETQLQFTTQPAFVFRGSQTGKKYLNVTGAWATNPPTGNIELDRVYQFAYPRGVFCGVSWADVSGREMLFESDAIRSGYHDPETKQKFPHATYTRSVLMENLHPSVGEFYKFKWATIRRLLLSCPPSEVRALLVPRLRIAEGHDSRFRDLGTRFGKYATLEYRLPCSLDGVKFGTCSCGQNKVLILTPDGEEMTCSACLAGLGGWENIPANFLEATQNISPLLAIT